MTDGNGNRARRWRVRGRVQGVFFRASTRECAEQLSLGGHARNLPDGSVEVFAVGAPGALDQLGQWLQYGPRMAEVDAVEATDEPVPDPPPSGFTTG